MGKFGKISAIKKEYGSSMSTDASLAKNGHSRIPGTMVFKYPYKELDGRYRTGLDPDASYIKRIQDPTAREVEIDRVTKLRAKLELALGGINLGPHSKFWNASLAGSSNDINHVQGEKLMDGDNFYDLSQPLKELAFSWLRVHPTIASSYQAWERGEYPSETQFYVVDDDIENQVLFKKKAEINKAIVAFEGMTPEKRKKIARLLGCPVTDETKESVVYNLVDTLLKQTEFKSGKYQGMTPVKIFNQFSDLKENLLNVKDLVKQAIAHSVYRIGSSGRIMKGEFEVAKSEEDLVKFLVDEDHQDELIMLEKELNSKKLIAVS